MIAVIERQGQLIKDFQKDQTELEAEIQRLQRALAFWLPHVPASDSARATRCGDDAMLLFGLEGDVVPGAEELGWIKFSYASEPEARQIIHPPSGEPPST